MTLNTASIINNVINLINIDIAALQIGTQSAQPNLEIWYWVEALNDLVCLKHAVCAIAHRNKVLLACVKVEAVRVTIDDADMSRRLRDDTERRQDLLLLLINADIAAECQQ